VLLNENIGELCIFVDFHVVIARITFELI